ncbi:MAG: CRISPR-associated helicase Cas3', partial [Candidatus Methanomethylophilaceae archaeon]
GYLTGLLHDFGKATDVFNDYITEHINVKRGDIDHSTAGAQYLSEKKNENSIYNCIAEQTIELTILSHHSGLINCLSGEGEDIFHKRLSKSNTVTHLTECEKRIGIEIKDLIDSVYRSAIDSLATMIQQIVEDAKKTSVKDNGLFRLGLVCRYILSCLIDADRQDTANFENGITPIEHLINWNEIRTRYYEFIDRFKNNDNISLIRRNISELCHSASRRDKGVFTLSVPTGGGKTLSSLRFAIEHLLFHGMDRIIYIVPYTSIIDQNVTVVKNALERSESDDIVRAYHSNIDLGEDDNDQDGLWRYSSDPWDSPIIFTTMVQFLETFYSSGTKRVRRMHNLANSVIIFDEIQTLPIKMTYMFNETVNFLVKWCGSSVLLCTATQPLLGKGLKYPICISDSSEIIDDVADLFNSMKRIEIERPLPDIIWNALEIANFAKKIIGESDSLLVITNTKSLARKIYDLIEKNTSDDILLYHLSTNMCPVHRRQVLSCIISNLGRKKLVCVSTQLIEAGIDVDFNSVIRCMAGLDSIAQAAGRCNRNNKMSMPGKVYIVKTDENLGSLIDIDEGRRCTESVLREYPKNILDVNAMNRYFELFFYNRICDMDYKTENPERTLFDILSANRASTQLYKGCNGEYPKMALRQSFMEANTLFNVINPVRSIIIKFDENAENIIADLCSEPPLPERVRLIRAAQKYSVNTLKFDRLLRNGSIKEVSKDSGIFYLLDGNYSNRYGLTESPVMNTIIF